jgi:ligand-binding sensor domain-containing protein
VQSLDAAQRYFWFGTPAGVTLYDLVTDTPVENFNDANGLPGDNVQAVSIDAPHVWVGTDAGLARYDLGREVWTQFRVAAKRGKEGRAAGLFSHNIKSLVDAGDFLWVGTRAGLSRYDKTTGAWQRIELPEQHALRSLAMDGRFLWIGTLKGLVLYDTASEQQLSLMAEHAPVRDIQPAPDGSVWFLLPNKLLQMYRDRREDVWVTIQGASRVETVASVARTKDAKSNIGIEKATCMAIVGGEIWIGKERGLVVYEPKKHRNGDIALPKELQHAKITDLAQDGDTLWVGTREGIFHYQPNLPNWTHFTQQDGLASNHVSAIAVDENAVWVGTADGGLSRYDKGAGRWSSYRFGDGPADNNIRAILADEGYVWFGTFSGGVCRYDKTTGLWTTFRTADYRGMP